MNKQLRTESLVVFLSQQILRKFSWFNLIFDMWVEPKLNKPTGESWNPCNLMNTLLLTSLNSNKPLLKKNNDNNNRKVK